MTPTDAQLVADLLALAASELRTTAKKCPGGTNAHREFTRLAGEADRLIRQLHREAQP